MSHEHKRAIERIVSICESSRQPTRRVERIYDIALEAQGYVLSQRKEMVIVLRQRAIQSQRDKAAKREEKKDASDKTIV